MQVKKILNDPKQVVTELLEGLIAAYGGTVKSLSDPRALVKTNLPPDKVGLLIGGGSGHEPLFPAFMGDNLSDGAACGNIFAAPTPNTILEATRALNQAIIMLRGKSISLNWKLQLLFSAIAIVSVLVISLGNINITNQMVQNSGDASLKTHLSEMFTQAIILGITVNAGVGVFAYFISRRITKPIVRATEIATKISQGDLSITVQESKSNDEIGKLLNAEKQMVSNLRNIISEVNNSSQSVFASAQQIAASGTEMNSSIQQISATEDQIARGSESQAQGLNKSKQIVDDLSKTIKEFSRDATESVEETNRVGILSEKGSESAKEAGQRMNNIIRVTNNSAEKVRCLAQKTSEITLPGSYPLQRCC